MALATCYRILVASNATSITSLLFNPSGPSGPALNVTSETAVGTQPSWVTGHPTNPSLAFTNLEQDNGMTIALSYDNTGNGTIVGQVPSGGAGPAFLLTTADAVFVANVRSMRPDSCASVACPFLTPSARMTSTVWLWKCYGRASVQLAPVLPRRATACSTAAQRFRSQH
jgi:hypothetical protein